MRQELKTTMEAVDAKENWVREQFQLFMEIWKDETRNLRRLEFLELGDYEFTKKDKNYTHRVWLSYYDKYVNFQDITDDCNHDPDYYTEGVSRTNKDYLTIGVIQFVMENFEPTIKNYIEQYRNHIDSMSETGQKIVKVLQKFKTE